MMAAGASSQAGSGALIRQLAAVDKETRDKGVAILTKWLKVKQAVSSQDLLKIWKGLFYCMWHSDKAPVQQELASNLSGILLQLQGELCLSYLSTFLVTIRREWAGIDALRLDKFYMLLRMFLRRCFELLDAKDWDSEVVRGVIGTLVEGGMSSEGSKAHSIGVSLHLADIFNDEMFRSEQAKAHAESVAVPLLHLMASEREKRVLSRLHGMLFPDFLKRCLADASDAKTHLRACCRTVAEKAFELAADPSTPAYNRKLLYEVHGKFAKGAGGSDSRLSQQPGQPDVDGSGDDGDEAEGDEGGPSGMSNGVSGPGRSHNSAQARLDETEDAALDGLHNGLPELHSAAEETHTGEGDTDTDMVAGDSGKAEGGSASLNSTGSKAKKNVQRNLTATLAVSQAQGGLFAVRREGAGNCEGEGDKGGLTGGHESESDGEWYGTPPTSDEGDNDQEEGELGEEEEEGGKGAEAGAQDEEEEEEGEEEEDEEEEEEVEAYVSASLRAGSTPHVKRRRLKDEARSAGMSPGSSIKAQGLGQGEAGQGPLRAGALGQTGSQETSPPPEGMHLPRLQVQHGGMGSGDLSDAYRTPEKHIVDAFSSAGFYTGGLVGEDEAEEGDEEGEGEEEGKEEGGEDGGEGAAGAGKAKGRKGRKKGATVPGAGKRGGKGGPGGSGRKRRVQFVMERNLFFEYGSAPAPTSVRTPPGSKPKGSALRPGVKPGPINMNKLMKAQETSPSQMAADGRKKKRKHPVRSVGLSPPQSLSTRFAVM